MKLKKTLLALFLAFTLVLTACGNSTDKSQEKEGEKVEDNSTKEKDNSAKEDKQKAELKDGTYEAEGAGFGGPIKIDVEIKDKKISDIKLKEDKETEPVFTRAFPVIKERIIDAQTPIVDNVSAATYSSFGVKSAVADALKEAGKDFGEIKLDTQPEKKEKAEKKAEQTQVLIVGGGPSGLSAAIEAKANGVEKVLLIEKLDILSGNGKFDMNFFDMINSKAMEKNGVSVSQEEFLEMKENAVDSPERKGVWAKGAAELDQWLRDMGTELNYNYGGEKGTGHMAEEDEYAGNVIQNGLEKKAKDLGVEIRTGTKGLDLIMEENKIKGVKVEDKTSKYDIMADAVIIATGGFSANKELLKEYAPGAEIVETSNQMGAQGDFVKVFEKNDLKLDHMDVLTVFKLIIKNRRDLTGAGDGFILVNEKGERFAAENSGGLELAHKILDQEKVFYIYDQPLYDSFYRLKKHNDLGYHKKAKDLDELAETLGIDKDGLNKTVEEYNKAFETGKDKFRDEMPENKFASEGPYYGVQVESAIHMTKGGVVANEKAQVLNNNDEVVEGLYASGEVTDTSGAYSASVVFGRIAGQQVAQYLNEK